MDILSYDKVNPQDILLNYSLPVGQDDEVFIVTFGKLDDYVGDSLTLTAIYSVAIGACLTLSFLHWAMSLNRKTPIFVLNQLTMLMMVTRASLFLGYLMGPLSSLSFSFTGILIPHSYASYGVTVAANVFQTLLVACIEASMTYQIFVIFRSPEVKRLGLCLTMAAAAGGLTIVGFYVNGIVANTREFQDIFNHTLKTDTLGSWVTDVPFILFSASINLMSCILALKLLFAIKTRRYLGLRQFDSFHILFIMTSQTMIIPSVLVIVNYTLSSARNDILSSISMLLVVVSLPFSSMWATAANNNPNPTSSTLAFLSRSSSNTSSVDTLAGNKFALFPNKLSKASTINSSAEKTLHDLPTTLTSLKMQHAHNFCLSNSSSPPSDIEQIIYNETNYDSENAHQSLGCHSNRESVDNILDNASGDGFVSVTTHNINQ